MKRSGILPNRPQHFAERCGLKISKGLSTPAPPGDTFCLKQKCRKNWNKIHEVRTKFWADSEECTCSENKNRITEGQIVAFKNYILSCIHKSFMAKVEMSSKRGQPSPTGTWHHFIHLCIIYFSTLSQNKTNQVKLK